MNVTYYVVVPFDWDDVGVLSAGQVQEASNAGTSLGFRWRTATPLFSGILRGNSATRLTRRELYTKSKYDIRARILDAAETAAGDEDFGETKPIKSTRFGTPTRMTPSPTHSSSPWRIRVDAIGRCVQIDSP